MSVCAHLLSHVQFDLMDCSPPGSSVHGIFQARILEWVAISSPGDLSNPGMESMSLALAGRFYNAESLGSPCCAVGPYCLPSLYIMVCNENQKLPSPLATTNLFTTSVSLFLFRRYVHLCHILDSTHK